jgi:peptidoglycan/LPS O-acetylase OafA/YrhL
MKYIKSLDGLRAFAVLLVIVSHYFPKTHWVNTLPNGALGVDVFFVLSGFLITSILFGYKQSIENGSKTVAHYLKVFYWRRTLRIFPIYYLYIGFMFLIGFTSVVQYWPYFVTYTTNILFFKIQNTAGTVSPVWSLAVEEQFYIIWPFLILFIPRKYLALLISTFILIGIGTKTLLIRTPFVSFLPFHAFDSFGVGAAIAYSYTFGIGTIKWKPYLLAGIILSIMGLTIQVWQKDMVFPWSVFNTLFAGCIVATLVQGNPPKWLQQVLENHSLVYIGKISYGIYLYHTYVPSLVLKLVGVLPEQLQVLSNLYISFAVNVLATILVATGSWYLIERPILRYKDVLR